MTKRHVPVAKAATQLEITQPAPSGNLLKIPSFYASGSAFNFEAGPNGWTSVGATRQTSAGVPINANTSLGITTYMACVNNISTDCAKTPMMIVKELDPRGRKEVKNHPLWQLATEQPNTEMTHITFWQLMYFWMLSWGNCYAEIQRFGMTGRPAALWPIHPSRVRLVRKHSGELIYEVTNDLNSPAGSGSSHVAPEDMFHSFGLSEDGLTGLSVLQSNASALGLSLAAQEFGARFYGNGTTLSGVIESTSSLGEEAQNNLRRSWKNIYQGTGNSHEIGILEEGMSYKAIGIPPDQAQFLETRAFQVMEICRLFRMPLNKIQSDVSSGYNKVEADNRIYNSETLSPWTMRVAQEFKRKLLTESRDRKISISHRPKIQGDFSDMATFITQMRQAGLFSADQGLELLDMNPIGGEEGEQRFMQAQQRTVQDIIHNNEMDEANKDNAAAREEEAKENDRAAAAKEREEEEERAAAKAEEEPVAEPGEDEEPPAEEEEESAEPVAEPEEEPAEEEEEEDDEEEEQKKKAAATARHTKILVNAFEPLVVKAQKAYTNNSNRVDFAKWQEEFLLGQAAYFASRVWPFVEVIADELALQDTAEIAALGAAAVTEELSSYATSAELAETLYNKITQTQEK